MKTASFGAVNRAAAGAAGASSGGKTVMITGVSKGLGRALALELAKRVNNAGTINRNNKIWEVPEEEFDAVIDTNVKGIANVLRHFIPLMLPKKQGIIVNFSSGWGRSGAALVAPYCASKWAVEGLTRSVAKELPDGMAVIALNPGVIHTEMLQSCFGTSASIYQEPDAW
ncbi:hypothetical protein GH714_006428 [Hevea brasiliensis]|uniref:Uncharacterized protein n=1 Tax=Hevea brasiliensis TaxID=3981 RepID=A0A6A6L138_HEVBR|nr:hypothetical protein GH714_006428 [Hevea brasiliensis]